jgi:hypothetical protein
MQRRPDASLPARLLQQRRPCRGAQLLGAQPAQHRLQRRLLLPQARQPAAQVLGSKAAAYLEQSDAIWLLLLLLPLLLLLFVLLLVWAQRQLRQRCGQLLALGCCCAVCLLLPHLPLAAGSGSGPAPPTAAPPSPRPLLLPATPPCPTTGLHHVLLLPLLRILLLG